MQDIIRNKQVALQKKIENDISAFSSEFNKMIDNNASLKELTYWENSEKVRTFSNNFHNNLMVKAGAPDDFNGVYLTAEWYKRNLYMWSFVEKNTTKPNEKVMVLVGSSHAAMFELFIRDKPDWKVTELKEIMEQ